MGSSFRTAFVTGLLCLSQIPLFSAILVSTNDAWEISNGTTVTAHSGMRGGFNPEAIFGVETSIELGQAVFADGREPGFTHFVEWQTPEPIRLSRIHLFAGGDGPIYQNQREFAQFVLKAKRNLSDAYSTVYTFTPSHPYTFLDSDSGAILATNVPPTDAKFFRAEFVQWSSGTPYDGPRVIELDAFAAPLETSIAQSTNDLWDVSNGSTVMSSSGLFSGFQETDAFGSTGSTERGQIVFADGLTNGSTHFLEWKTLTPVRLTNFNLFAAGDGDIYNNEREFASFVLKAKLSNSDEFQTIYSFSPEHPYQLLDLVSLALISANVIPVNAQYFRAEFVQWNAGRGYDGPRVVELDGYGTILQPSVPQSTNDLWDASQQSTVLATSALRPGFAASDAFGTLLSPERGQLVFADGKTNGSLHYMEWKSRTPIRLTGFNLFAGGDGAVYLNEREFAKFTLKAKRFSSDDYATVYTFSPSHPYQFLDAASAAILSATIPQTDAQFFRAEFIQWNAGRGFDGPRVIELDAVATVLPNSQSALADWTFEEGVPGQFATNIVDHSGNEQHGFPVGNPLYVPSTGGDLGEVALQIANVAHFRRTSESFKFLTNDFTLEAIVQPLSTSTATNQAIIAAHNPNDGRLAYLLGYNAEAETATFFLIASNGLVQSVSAPLPIDGNSHHLAVSRSGRNVSIYVDRALTQSRELSIFPNFPLSGPVDLRVGSTSFGSRFEGTLNRVRISLGALTASEFIEFTAPPVRIVEQPRDQAVNAGESATFFVRVDASSPVVFQWSFNGSPISGATNSSLVLSNVQPASAGTYVVAATANGRTITSVPVRLTVMLPPSGGPVQDDLFDVAQGNQVIRHSGMFPSVSPAGMFGDASPSLEPKSTIFADGRTNGFNHFIQWRTPAPVNLRAFKLFAGGDGPVYLNEREFESFVLMAKSSPSSTNFDRVIYSYSATHPYTYLNPTNFLLIDATLADPVTAQEFRAEFVQWNAGRGYDGPRIVELDGFGEFLSSPSTTVADWTFENGTAGESVHFVPDVSGSENHITTVLGNSAVFLPTDTATAGAISVSLPSGDGGFGNALRAPDSSDFNMGNQFTLEASVNPGSDNDTWNRGVVVGQDATTGRLVYVLDYRSENRSLNFAVINSQGEGEPVSAIIPNDGISHHVAGVYNSGSLNIYLDKQLVASKTTTLVPGLSPGGAGRVTLGANDIGGYWFNGILDRVRISRQALTPEQFFAHRRDTNAPLTIVQPLQNLTVAEGGAATFQVTATGPSGLTYTWSHNDTIIPQQTNGMLVLENVQSTNAGTYKVVVTSGPWEATSTATLVVTQPTNSAPVILVQPVSRRVPIGAFASFSVVAAGSPPLTYQWKWDGQLLPGETMPSLVFSNVSHLQAGEYSVEVRNDFGVTNSFPARLTVVAPDTNGPTILISSPSPGVTSSNRVTLAGTILDNESVSHATWFRNHQLVGPLVLSNNQFSVPNILLSAGTNTFTIRAYDESGNAAVASVSVIMEVQRAIWISSALPVQEGARVNLPISVSSAGEVGALSFSVLYDTNYLSEPRLEFLSLEAAAFTQVNVETPGVIRATYVLPGRTLPAGPNTTLASVRFRTRSVPEDLSTPVRLELQGLYSAAGDPISSGASVGSGVVPITRRDYIGDNNANDRLDIADATAIIRMITLLDPVRPWDVTGNDLNQNASLDAGDIVRVLRVIVNLDPQPSGGNGGLSPLVAKGNTASKIGLTASNSRLAAGEQVKVTVSLANLEQAISGVSFRLDYPVDALRLESAASHRAGSLVPQNALSIWNLLPGQDYGNQSGTIHFAASSAAPWADNDGDLGELTFTVLPGAASQYAWPVRLAAAEAASGLDPISLGSAQIILIGREAQAATLADVQVTTETVELRLRGEAGVRYRIESSTDLQDWAEVGIFSDASGTLLVSEPFIPDASRKFYRAVQLD